MATARIAHRTLKLYSRRCQTLERCTPLGLCCALEKEAAKAGAAKPREEMLRLWGSLIFPPSGAAASGQGKITSQPHFGELVSHNCMILSLKTLTGMTQ